MRRDMFALAATLVMLAACDDKPAAQDARSADQALASDNLDSNDLTAIDAASGADSNMAADIDFTNMALNAGDGDGDEDTSGNRQSPRPVRLAPVRRASPDSPPDTNESAPPETEDGAN